MFFGVYHCTQAKGKLFFPFEPDGFSNVWKLVVREGKACVLVMREEERVALEADDVLGEGEFLLSVKRTWCMPRAVLAQLEGKECVWIGCGNHVELKSFDDYSRELAHSEEEWHRLKDFDF